MYEKENQTQQKDREREKGYKEERDGMVNKESSLKFVMAANARVKNKYISAANWQWVLIGWKKLHLKSHECKRRIEKRKEVGWTPDATMWRQAKITAPFWDELSEGTPPPLQSHEVRTSKDPDRKWEKWY